MRRQLFIGGSGRSGTLILLNIMGTHKDIFNLPIEMRFIIDPDGLIDLVDALTVNYSPFLGREALYRFQRLMTEYLAQPGTRPYLDYNFPEWFGRDFYFKTVDEFISGLTEYEFWGSSVFENPPAPPLNAGTDSTKETQTPAGKRKIKGATYFPDRGLLIKKAAEFVDTLFSHAAAEKGKPIWVEKTPFNILHAEFLWELFPEAGLIHIKRDPRAVANSLANPAQPWAPNDIRSASLFLRSTLERWFDVKKRLHLENRPYLEVKLEELVHSTPDFLQNLANFCGVENTFPRKHRPIPEKVDYWKTQMSSQDITIVEEVLGPYTRMMGY